MTDSYFLRDTDEDWWVSDNDETFTLVTNPEEGTLYSIPAFRDRTLAHIEGQYGILDDGVTTERLPDPSDVVLAGLRKALGSDPVNSPSHYTSHPSGIEVIEFTRHMGFCLGNVVKYVMRADLKVDAMEDLRKAIKYLEFEIETRERAAA